ncbi:MAG: hypothetical protein HOP30_20985 [Cyclobacteriaceae bacterium]|nr:hypothetical protein [Cyclobacteriaceae bacterium]
MDNQLLDQINHVAETVRNEFQLTYDLGGIRLLEEIVNNNRSFYENLSDQERKDYSFRMGLFLGVCMVRNYQGRWEENQMGVVIDNSTAHPIQKTYKFLSPDGAYDSISTYYELAGSLNELDEPHSEYKNIKIVKATDVYFRKNWWKFWR